MLRKSVQFYNKVTVNENVDTEKKTMKLAESELNYANMHALSTPYKCQERFLLK